MSSKDQKKYHFLVAALIIFKDKSDDSQIMKVELNTVVEHETDDIPVKLLGRAQQAAQIRFFKEMSDSQIQVIDVVILNMIRMGYMTSEEFKKGMTPAEVRPVASNDPIQ